MRREARSEKLEARSEKGRPKKDLLDIVYLTGLSVISFLTIWLNSAM